MSLSVVEISWNGDHSVLDSLTEEGLSDFFHFDKDHSRDLFWGELFCLTLDLGFDVWFAIFVNDLVRKIVFIGLDSLVGEFTTYETFDVVNSVSRVQGSLIFGGLTDKSFFFAESYD